MTMYYMQKLKETNKYSMINFRTFLESEEVKNVKQMIAKLPKGHQALLDGYKFRFQGGNTLKDDDENIGQIYKDKITVAAPWNYPREFTTLHEVGHLVYEYKMTPKLKKEWSVLVKEMKPEQVAKMKELGQKTDALQQNDEELFCMAYASAYAKRPPIIFHHPDWIDFIEKSVPN
jgi:hypothetical protein